MFKKGDWNCPQCGHLCFGSKDECYKCGARKPRDPIKKKGDWECSCGELNFASRLTCRKCSKPKNDAGVADWICSCGETNFESRNECRKCGKTKSIIKPGDWNCSCGESNFASRHECRKCGKLAPVAPVKAHPGDWVCACTEMNFGNRVVCRKCGISRPVPPAAAEPKSNKSETDIDCKVCMERPFNTCINTCGHIAMCMECANKLASCPICRQIYTPSDVKIVYMS